MSRYTELEELGAVLTAQDSFAVLCPVFFEILSLSLCTIISFGLVGFRKRALLSNSSPSTRICLRSQKQLALEWQGWPQPHLLFLRTVRPLFRLIFPRNMFY